MNMPLTIPSPLEVERRHRKRRIAELAEFLDHGRPGETYSTTARGRIIVIRKVLLLDGRPHTRRVTLAYLGERSTTWTVDR
jgi:hypothetical protein